MSRWGKGFRRVMGARALWRARRVERCRILVVGVYMRDMETLAPEVALGLASRRHEVTQAWASIGTGQHGAALMQPWTRLEFAQPVPKFTVINALLAQHDLRAFTHVVVSDDDIEFPPRFLDDYIGLQEHYGFALAQPARSVQSNIDHRVTRERHSRMARQTRFVEIGPLFSVAASAFPVLLPFDESFYMGWGLDHVWPVALARAGLTMGVIDRTPIHHRFRPVASSYPQDSARARMAESLVGRETIASRDRRHPVRSHWF